MRVALLAQHCPAGDAIGRQTVAKLTFFLDRGAQVRLFVESDHNLHPGVGPHCRVVGSGQDAAVWDYLASADLVLAEYGHAYQLLTLLPLLTGPGRLVLDYHGVTPAELWSGPSQESPKENARQRGVIWCSDAAIVHSQFTQTELLAATGFPASQVHLVDYPVDPVFFALPDHSGGWRRRLGLASATVLLFVGRVAANKRLPILVEALAHLQGHNPPVHAVLIGDASGVYAAETERCRQRAAGLGVADRLHFLGQVTETCLLEAYRSADVLVIPSRHEGYCLPVVEGMACGLPVVAAHAGALPETIGEAGLTFRPDDAADLACQVGRILDGALREHMRRRGKERAGQRQQSAWRQRFGQLVEKILDDPPRPRQEKVQLLPPGPSCTAAAGRQTHLLPMRFHNGGTIALLPEGLGRTRLCCQLPPDGPVINVPLPCLVMPGQTVTVAVPLPLPPAPGAYEVMFWTERLLRDEGKVLNIPEPAFFQLVVKGEDTGQALSPTGPMVEEIEGALVQAHRAHKLPEDYVDLSTGWLASWKRRLKHKLLNNFKRGYVEVLARQQSEFNRHLLTAVQGLAQCCAALHQAVQQVEDRLARLEASEVRQPGGERGALAALAPRGQKTVPNAHTPSETKQIV